MTRTGYAELSVVEANPLRNAKSSRRLLLPERTMYRDGKTPFTSVFTIKLAGSLEEARLREALARVQAKHPLLRCVIEESASGPQFVLQEKPQPIPLRMIERKGEGDWQFEVRREWTTPFRADSEPLIRMVWLYSDGIHELMLIGHHCICDGHSGINLLRELLSIYDQPEQNLRPYDTLSGAEDIVPSTVQRSSGFRRHVRRKAAMLRLGISLKQFLSRGATALKIAPDQMYFHRWRIDRDPLLALIERCREEEVTVLAAMSIAFMQAFRDVSGPRALSKAYAMVNARRFMPQLRLDALFGVVPGVSLRMKDLPPAQEIAARSFWARARAVKADMTLRVDRLGSGLYSYLMALESMHDKYERLISDTESAPAVRHITLSNMGRIDLPQRYRSFRLETVYSPLVMVSPTPANTVVLSSFAGEMELAIVSDVQSLPYAKAQAIEQRVMEILRVCVAVPVQYESDLSKGPSPMRAETI